MQKTKAFTLIELLVVISIIALLIGILLPAMGRARKVAKQTENSTQIRSIIQAMLMHASRHQDSMPGISGRSHKAIKPKSITYSSGDGHSVEGRFAILLEQAIVTPEILISPGESKKPFDANPSSPANISSSQFSYAMLQIDTPGARKDAWGGGGRASESVIMSDRLTEGTTGNPDTYKSIWLKKAGEWNGSVGFGDGHNEFLKSSEVAVTRYGSHEWEDDDLFAHESDSGDDINRTWTIAKGTKTTKSQ